MRIADNSIWEYDKANRLNSLIAQKGQWYFANDEGFWLYFFDSTFDLSGNDDFPVFGLVVWALILNVPLDLMYPLIEETPWGVGPFRENFRYANFSYSGTAANLTKKEKVQTLRMVYYKHISNGTVPFINMALKNVFSGDGKVYIADRNDMVLEYVFKFTPSNNFLTALRTYDILPSVAGVKTIITVSP